MIGEHDKRPGTCGNRNPVVCHISSLYVCQMTLFCAILTLSEHGIPGGLFGYPGTPGKKWEGDNV